MIELKQSQGFRWRSINGLQFRGYLLDQKEEDLAISLAAAINEGRIKDILDVLSSVNGNFAAVMETEKYIIAMSDRVRSIPLFYRHDTDFMLFDSVNNSAVECIDKTGAAEFVLTGYTFNDRTLLKSVKQIEPCTIIVYNKELMKLEKLRYFSHVHDKNGASIEKISDELDEISHNMFRSLIESAAGRMLVVPLSGGYDSRYILSYLVRMGYKNIICYTYGKSDSFEVQIANRVALSLGVKIITIEYSENDWVTTFNSEDFRSYISQAFNFASVPHIQDFMALDYIKRNSLIPNDAIIVPGFCGDLIGGSYLPDFYVDNPNNNSTPPLSISDYIMGRHLVNADTKLFEQETEAIKEDIIKFISSMPMTENDVDTFISLNEAWFTEHKVSRFVVNAVRAFEFFGYEWRMPLWDVRLTDAWYGVPNYLRVDNRLYNEFVFNCLFKPMGVDILKPTPLARSRYIKRVRRFIPRSLFLSVQRTYRFVYTLLRSEDINNFGALGNTMAKSLINDVRDIKNINGILAIWILEQLKVSNDGFK